MPRASTENDVVVVIIPDSGTRYLSKIYNDNWMKENQFLEPRFKSAPARLFATRCAAPKDLVSIPLGITVEDAVNLMREHDISQVPVIEGGEVVGSISEAAFWIFWFPTRAPSGSLLPNTWKSRFRSFPKTLRLPNSRTRWIAKHRRFLCALHGFDIITKSDLIFFLTKRDGEKVSR